MKRTTQLLLAASLLLTIAIAIAMVLSAWKGDAPAVQMHRVYRLTDEGTDERFAFKDNSGAWWYYYVAIADTNSSFTSSSTTAADWCTVPAGGNWRKSNEGPHDQEIYHLSARIVAINPKTGEPGAFPLDEAAELQARNMAAASLGSVHGGRGHFHDLFEGD